MDAQPIWPRLRTTDKKSLFEEWVENVSSNGSNTSNGWDDWPTRDLTAPN